MFASKPPQHNASFLPVLRDYVPPIQRIFPLGQREVRLGALWLPTRAKTTQVDLLL